MKCPSQHGHRIVFEYRVFNQSAMAVLALYVLFQVFCVKPLCASGIPRLQKVDGSSQLLVDDKPFLVLGAQVHNSSGWPSALTVAWPTIEALHCNTVMIPAYWEAIERQPGTFDFTMIDAAIEGAHEHHVKVVFLWFGTWKNGAMTYVPSWVKQDATRYPLMQDSAGKSVTSISPSSVEAMKADGRAFASLMGHIRDKDSVEHTVIMVQVENEAGVLGTDRDYSPSATKEYLKAVPSDVLRSLHKSPGTWAEVFGERAPEAFTSYEIAQYIDYVAQQGKAAYPLPMYVNVWPREQPGLIRPGFSSPSGGAVSYLIEMWKSLASHIDIIGPDNYDSNVVPYLNICNLYNRADNPLFVPETGGTTAHAKNMFYVLATRGALGVSTFGVDEDVAPESLKLLSNPYAAIAANYGLLGSAIPELMAIRENGNLHAAVEEDGIANPELRFDAFDAVARFGKISDGYGGSRGNGNPNLDGRVLIGQLARDEFLVAGMNANIMFAPKLGARKKKMMYLSVEQGHYHAGVWVTDRQLNGDETYFGLVLSSSGTMLRVKVLAY